MVYRFKIVSDEAPKFRLEIQISSDATFLQLRSAILDACGYSRIRPDAFFLCDEDWEPRELIALEDPGTDSDTDVWLMDETPLEDLVEEEGQRMLFVFDAEHERAMSMEMREMLFGRHLSEPVCTLRQGKAPSQVQAAQKPEPKKADAGTKVLDELGLDFYGSDGYNDDELPEGFDGDGEDEEDDSLR